MRGERRDSNLILQGFSNYQIKREYFLFYYNAFRGIWPWYKVLFNTSKTILLSKFPGTSGFLRKIKNNNGKLYDMINKY